jgi:hypothetical protein
MLANSTTKQRSYEARTSAVIYMKKIQLYRSNLFMLVDDADYEYLKQFRWIKRREYAARHIQTYPQKYQLAHREILPNEKLIDHINRNTLDNQRHNLRPANKSQNASNCKIHKHNTSGFKGVSKMKDCFGYRAYIVIDDKQKHLGCFNTAEQAAEAYNDAALKFFGEFANINIIDKK